MTDDQQINRRLTRIEDQIDAILSQLPGEKKEKPNTLKRAQDIVTLIAATLAVIAGSAFIFYAFGYMIVNSYLASFGVRVSELTNPAYIPAGLSFVFVALMIPALVIALSGDLQRRLKSSSTIRRTLTPVLTTFFFVLIFTYFVFSRTNLESPYLWLYPVMAALLVSLLASHLFGMWSKEIQTSDMLLAGW